MTFITLAESKTATKGNIIVTVTKIGDLKAGSSSNGDWTRKDITVQDVSGSENMSVWNKDIEKFVLNHKYELTGIYWKQSNGKSYLNFGQFSQIKDLGTSPENGQAKIEESDDNYLKERQAEIKEKSDIKPLDEKNKELVHNEAELLVSIRNQVETTVKECVIDPHPGMIWEMTALIWRKHFGELEK